MGFHSVLKYKIFEFETFQNLLTIHQLKGNNESLFPNRIIWSLLANLTISRRVGVGVGVGVKVLVGVGLGIMF